MTAFGFGNELCLSFIVCFFCNTGCTVDTFAWCHLYLPTECVWLGEAVFSEFPFVLYSVPVSVFLLQCQVQFNFISQQQLHQGTLYWLCINGEKTPTPTIRWNPVSKDLAKGKNSLLIRRNLQQNQAHGAIRHAMKPLPLSRPLSALTLLRRTF